MECRNESTQHLNKANNEWESQTLELTYLFRFPFPIADYISNTSIERNLLLTTISYGVATIASGMGVCAFIPMATFVTIPMDVMHYTKIKINECLSKQQENNTPPLKFFAKKMDVSDHCEAVISKRLT
ncbi:MAG TPA: hypothetical protein VHM20_03245 [Gammaproteobacteria bacterium]|jgi:hypothetical protein|nr:hypothetical protein [Gammaproteobacteria bacterium]